MEVMLQGFRVLVSLPSSKAPKALRGRCNLHGLVPEMALQSLGPHYSYNCKKQT